MERTPLPPEHADKELAAFAGGRLRAINYRVLTAEKLLGLVERFGLYGDLKGAMPPGEIEARMRDDIRLSVESAEASEPQPGEPAQAAIVFTVGYEGESPEISRRVADALASLYVSDDIRFRQRRWDESRRASDAAISGVQQKLAAAEEKIAQYRQEHQESMPEHSQANAQAVAEVDRRIAQAEDEEQALKERESALQAKLDTVSPGNPYYDPLVKSLGAVRTKLVGMDRLIRALEKKGVSLRRRMEDAPVVEKGFKEIEAARDALRTELDALTNKAEAESAAFELDRSRHSEMYAVASAARLPKWPSKPNFPAILLAGLLLGLAGGVTLAAWRESWNDGICHTLEQISVALPYPVLAAIPALRTPSEIRRQKTGRILILGTAVAGVIAGVVLFQALK